MPEGEGPNLTGVWQGLFTYPGRYGSVFFGATLIETASWVSGSTHEPCTVGRHKGTTLYATLLGRREGLMLRFVKTYDGTADHKHSIDYEGAVSDDFTEVEGIWRISSSWSGRFLMIRPGRHTIEEKREAFEKA